MFPMLADDLMHAHAKFDVETRCDITDLSGFPEIRRVTCSARKHVRRA